MVWSANKSLFRSRWILPAACGAVAPTVNGPGAHFFHTGGEVGLQAEQLVSGADHPVQARLLDAQIAMNSARSFVVQLGDVRLDGAADDHDNGVLGGGYRTDPDPGRGLFSKPSSATLAMYMTVGFRSGS